MSLSEPLRLFVHSPTVSRKGESTCEDELSGKETEANMASYGPLRWAVLNACVRGLKGVVNHTHRRCPLQSPSMGRQDKHGVPSLHVGSDGFFRRLEAILGFLLSHLPKAATICTGR